MTTGTTAINPAEIIIKDYIELNSMSPDRSSWSESYFKDNPPRYYRFKRMASCFEVLGYQNINYESLTHTINLPKLNEDQINSVISTIETAFPIEYEQYLEKWSFFSPRTTFDFLIRMLVSIYSFNFQRSGVLEASGYHMIPVLMLEHLEEKLTPEKEAVEKTLCLLLNPEEKTYNPIDLVTKYDFPLVDLEEIDLDWL